MDVLKETFSESSLESDSVEEEIEAVKEQLRDTQPADDIDFYIDHAGVAVMKFGPTLKEEIPRTGFEKGSDVKRLMRKLEDLAYAKEHGEFPESAPRYTLIGHEPNEREQKAEEHNV